MKKHEKTIRSLKKKGWVEGYVIKTCNNNFYKDTVGGLERVFFAYKPEDLYRAPYSCIKAGRDRIVKVNVHYQDVVVIEEIR